jgi:hypothetical protein
MADMFIVHATSFLFAEFFKIVKNRGAVSVLDGKGFRYCDFRILKKSGIEVWRCSKRKRSFCKASVHILGEHILDHFEEHNHGPENF